jgi:hypothetical protein
MVDVVVTGVAGRAQMAQALRRFAGLATGAPRDGTAPQRQTVAA